MAAKSKAYNPLSGMHTAGIFSDMSIDGPDIGTLVLIVDRAKNLPNRKTIGKQDPYCAARLGKEAKKTTTDIRGGQTPKWDQELRFTVHDSPDYFQLKLSVFNDDKKTELIGETWIDLRDIVVPGGGQSDQWHNLSCRGKYAGNIRIEITYYDSRPKPDMPFAKSKPVASSSEQDTAGSSQRPGVKRRPLPSDPVTGQLTAHASDPAITTPRVHPNPLSGPVANQSPSLPGEYTTPNPKRHPHHPHRQQQHPQLPQHSQHPSHPQHVQQSPQPQPQPQPPQPDHHSPAHASGYQFSTPPQHREYLGQRMGERPESFPTLPHEPDFIRQPEAVSPMPHEADARGTHNAGHQLYSSQAQSVPHRRSLESVPRPPQPPAHGVRNAGGHSPDVNATPHGNYDLVQHKGTPPLRHDVLRNEAHRYSGPLVPATSSAYPGRPTYRPSESTPNLLQTTLQYNDYNSQVASTQHRSYNSMNDRHRPLQPTVEDVPESWTPPKPRSRSSVSQYDELEHASASNPNLSNGHRHPDVLHERYSTGQLQLHARHDGYGHNTSPAEYSQALTHVPRSQAYYQQQAIELDNHMYGANDHSPAAIPPTLVPGVDPNMSREVGYQDRKDERRYSQPMEMVVHSRGRQHSEPPSHYGSSYSPHGQHTTSPAYAGAPVAYSSRPHAPTAAAERVDRHRVSPSPNPHHKIKRKSVSPAPPPSEPRRSSGVPFGPDSYDALNPSLAASREGSNSADYTNANGKIVTSDGREVDPSDHLPIDTWAPEPDARQTAQPTETRSRPALSGAQPMPPSGRRQLRIAARPNSMVSTSPVQPAPGVTGPSSTGYNRLQKKNHRASALPASVSVGSLPLGPATAHQRNSTPPRALVQTNMYDYENHGPPTDGGHVGAHMGSRSGPPRPAKVPMMSGGLDSVPRGNDELALMAEMSRIDIGAGRARRHGR
ncbi:hypothetical protein GGR50DRAFT_414085 [Xylaria sp. CBS 124048]|nr:hypothetical protein GGR50DRAFT_414085 [Xylaria sp. CBS 124048]